MCCATCTGQLLRTDFFGSLNVHEAVHVMGRHLCLSVTSLYLSPAHGIAKDTPVLNIVMSSVSGDDPRVRREKPTNPKPRRGIAGKFGVSPGA